MGIGDVAGVFSRYFIVGFFLPGFAALVVLSVTVSNYLLPNEFERQSAGAQIAILGVSGLLLGLLLQGLSYTILRGYEGYGFLRTLEWLESSKRRSIWRLLARPIRSTRDRLLARQTAHWKALRQARRGDPNAAIKPADAAWRLKRQFPEKREHILPTAFGNSIKAFETSSNDQWGLDGVAVTPPIGAFMTDKEHEIHSDAKADVMFFINLSLLTSILGSLWLLNWSMYQASTWCKLPLYLLAFVASYAAYRGAIGAAQRWGSVIRSEIYLHRMELYMAIGIREPRSFSDERSNIGPAVSRFILHGNYLPDDLRATPNAGNIERKSA